MGRKSKTAGTTKTRQRTCDKEAMRTNIDKVKGAYGRTVGRKGKEMKTILSQVKQMEEEARIEGVDEVKVDTWGGMGNNAKYQKKRPTQREYTGGNNTKCVVLSEDTIKDKETGKKIPVEWDILGGWKVVNSK